MASALIPLLLVMYILISLINKFGKDLLIEVAWSIYLLLPLPIREQIRLQKKAQNELLQTSASLKSTSSQDEFAKWARLNRQHDKQIQDLQQLTAIVDGHKAKFKRGTGILIWLGTTGVKGIVQWWFSKQPVFWLPAGAFPGWMEYVLAFPKAPRGSVSTMVFGMCATRAIGFAIGLGKELVNAKKPVQNAPVTSESRFEEVTTEEKKTL